MHGTQEEWRTECPHCRNYNFIRFDDVKFDKEEFDDEEGQKQYTVSNTRWMCPICKRETPEIDVKRCPAKWFIKNPKAIQNGVRSFRLNAFMSPWSDWKYIIRKFLKAGKDPEKLMIFYNTILGESWEIRTQNGLDDKLYMNYMGKRTEHELMRLIKVK